MAEAVAGALPGAQGTEKRHRTWIAWQRAFRPSGDHGPVQADTVCAVVGPSGEWVQVEATGRPGSMVPMLAAFAQGRQE
ncbi:hypothetical protein ACWC2T_44190 [Streptomyces sp. NPDC001393]